MKKVTRILALALSVVMCLSLVVGCGKKDGGNSGAKDTLVVGYSPFSSKFSPLLLRDCLRSGCLHHDRTRPAH
ncbi:MAG: hypothetical protein ACLSHM_02635 [Vescimonas sp.]